MMRHDLKRTLAASAAISIAVAAFHPSVAAAQQASTQLQVGITIQPVEGQSWIAAPPSAPDEEFLDEVRLALLGSPSNGWAVLREARVLRPHLWEEIDALYSSTAPDVEGLGHVDEAEQTDAASGSGGGSTALLVGGAGALAVGGIAVAMGGGGGSSGGSDKKGSDPEPAPPPKDRPAPPPPPPHDYSRDPADYLTDEYSWQHGLATIKANEAYARGYAGQGVTVAVVDSGLDADHPEFAGRIVHPYNAFKDEHGNSYSSEHGTHVAGIIGAARDGEGMHGVAWLADIMPINFARDEDGYMRPGTDGERVGRSWKHAARNGAHVVNNSWGLPGHEVGSYTRGSIERAYPQLVEGMHELVANDVISVFAAHNQRNPDPSAPASFPMHFPELKGYWVAVAALGTDGELADFSNACGVAADWCITAPGQTIRSTILDGKYGRLSGTSMATPHVAGALAVLKSMFPHLTAPELTEILFTTADDMGDRKKYGHGLLNLERASRPIGTLAVPLSDAVDGKAVSLNGSRLRLSGAFGDGVVRSLEGHSVMALDSYGRDYHVELSDLAHTGRQTRQDALHRLKLFGGIEERSVSTIDAGPFSITTASRLRASDPAIGHTPYARMSFSLTGEGYSLAASMNPDLGRQFGMRETGLGRAALIDGHSFDLPHLSLMETGFASTMGVALDDAVGLRLGVYTGSVETDSPSLLSSEPSMVGAIAEIEGTFEGVSLRASAGAVSEEGSLLGSVSEGAFGDDMRATTFFANAGTSIDLAENTRFTFSGSLGLSSFRQGSGLIRSGSGIVTSSFGVGISRSDFLRKGDVLTLAAGQPMRVEGGRIDLSVPTSRTADGGVNYRRLSLSPAPSGRELNLQATYAFELAEGVAGSVGGMHRFNADHVSGRSETLGMLSVSLSF